MTQIELIARKILWERLFVEQVLLHEKWKIVILNFYWKLIQVWFYMTERGSTAELCVCGKKTFYYGPHVGRCALDKAPREVSKLATCWVLEGSSGSNIRTEDREDCMSAPRFLTIETVLCICAQKVKSPSFGRLMTIINYNCFLDVYAFQKYSFDWSLFA